MTTAASPPAVTGVRVGGDSGAWSAAGFEVQGSTIQIGALTIEIVSAATPPELVLGRDSGGSISRDPHSNGIDGIDHIVVMARTLDGLRGDIDEAGWTVRRERPTTMAGIEVVQLFVLAGEVLLEMIAPIAGEGPVEGVWGLAVTSTDLGATSSWFAEHCGAESCGTVSEAVQPGRRIATLRHRALGLPLPVAIMSPRPPSGR